MVNFVGGVFRDVSLSVRPAFFAEPVASVRNLHLKVTTADGTCNLPWPQTHSDLVLPNRGPGRKRDDHYSGLRVFLVICKNQHVFHACVLVWVSAW